MSSLSARSFSHAHKKARLLKNRRAFYGRLRKVWSDRAGKRNRGPAWRVSQYSLLLSARFERLQQGFCCQYSTAGLLVLIMQGQVTCFGLIASCYFPFV